MATKPMRGPGGRAMHATERPKNTGKTMRRTMAFILKHYKWHCLAVVICIVLTVLAQLNGTLFLQKLYDSYLSPMLESGSTDFTPLLHKLIQVGAVYAIGVLCSWGYPRLMVNVSQGTMRNFREKLFGHMESLPISYFDTHSHGDIMSVYTNDIDTLRRLTQAAEEIMWRTAGTVNIRNSWGNRVPTWLPLYSQMKGQRIGVTRSQMAQGITIATQGYRLGEYREGDQFMPILLKDENIDTYNLTNLQALPIFTPAGKVYSIEQATDGFRFEYRVGVVKRDNRQRVMKAQCDPGRGVNTMQLYATLRDSVLRGVVLPEGYSMKVFGEQESQQESNSALARYMPLTMVLIFIVLLLLFRNYREPAVILLMIPLIFIGVVLGLAVTGKVFNFFSLLGLLGLVGMNIKNAVVLVEQIGVLRSEGKGAYEALTAATRSRIVPVAMASGTTILGMLPLLFDSMFGAMAATIMGGLLVATLLTVCVLPVVYAIFYNIRKS